jgi:uncharacterized protein (TIGR02246 family)
MRNLITIFILTIAAAVSISAQAADQEILKIHASLDDAFLKKDIAVFERIYTDDYVFSSPQGRMFDRTTALADMRKEFSDGTYKVVSAKTENPRVKIMGNTALITADWSTGTMRSDDPRADSHMDRGRYTGVYEKRDGKWMLIAEHFSEAPHDRKLMEQQVLKMGQMYSDIIKRQDHAALDRLYADEYLFTNERGQVKNKAQDIESWKTKPAKFEVFDTTDQKVRVIGNNVAVETGTVTFKGTAHDGKAFEGSERYTTTWVWRQGRWQVVADHVSSIAK